MLKTLHSESCDAQVAFQPRNTCFLPVHVRGREGVSLYRYLHPCRSVAQ